MEKIAVSIMFILLTVCISLTFIRDLQLNGYRLKFTIDNIGAQYFLPMICALVMVFTAHYNIVGLAFLVGLLVIFSIKYAKLRTKIKLTRRAIRLLSVYTLLVTCAHILNALLTSNIKLFVTSSFVSVALFFVIVIIAHIITLPVETLNNNRYIKATKKQLDRINAIKIAITGSAGKTSCKEILKHILEKKYTVLATTGNYNTPMGLVLTMKNYNSEEVIIAEMGARRKGDIKKLTEIFKPRYALVTGVTHQHVETFGNIDKVYETKKELVDSLNGEGFAVFNGENEYGKLMYHECQHEKILVGFHDEEVVAKDISMSSKGSEFCVYGMGEPFMLSTRLLGKHNIQNILLCVAIATKLGVSRQDIIDAVSEIEPIKHRLEIIKTDKLTIIDDSYNANVIGTKEAVNVLALFKGRKVIFSQGIVELGRLQERVNIELGEHIARIADLVLLTGENSKFIRQGLVNMHYDGEIIEYKSFKLAQESLKDVLQEGDVFLIQNDIP